MITNVILTVVNVVISATDALLPHLTIPSWLSAGTLIPSGVSNTIGAALYTASPILPAAIFAEIFVGVASMWPFVAAYTVAQWVFRHVPTIAGFGMGNG